MRFAAIAASVFCQKMLVTGCKVIWLNIRPVFFKFKICEMEFASGSLLVYSMMTRSFNMMYYGQNVLETIISCEHVSSNIKT